MYCVGALGAGDVLVEHVVSLVTAPESITALRNVILIGKVWAAPIRKFFTPCLKEFRRLRRRCGRETALAIRPRTADRLAGRAPRPGGCCQRHGDTRAGAGKGERFAQMKEEISRKTLGLAISTLVPL
jgi:hypothetical protein